jgi:hypothetical protein
MKTKISEKEQFKQRIATSNLRIKTATEVLASHHRGRQVASGLDSQGLNALSVLITEFKDGRRDFVYELENLKIEG